MIVASNSHDSDTIGHLEENRPELVTFRADPKEASLTFVEAERGGDDINQHQRKHSALSYPNSFIPVTTVILLFSNFVHQINIVFDFDWAIK